MLSNGFWLRDRTGGQGQIDRARVPSCPIPGDEHVLLVCCYVERNARRAGLVTWSS
jgi:putative transposase